MSSERYIPEHRRTQFKAKKTFKPDELRRRREEQQVEIRKAKREENLAKRRGITGRDGTQSSAPGASLGASIDSDDEGGTIESQVCSGHALCRSHMVILTAAIASFVVFSPWIVLSTVIDLVHSSGYYCKSQAESLTAC